MSTATDPSDLIVAAQRRAAVGLPFADDSDIGDADRGFLAALDPAVVTTADGTVVWDNDSYDFLRGPCPDSVHPGLWRQSGLTGRHGLFQVTEGIYQIRGLDLSNMTLVEGDSGVVVIDPLSSAETAAAGLALYRDQRGDRPVTGLIYTRAQVDHFGGALGVTTAEEVAAGRCPVLAPAGFLDHAAAENLYAGTATARRAAYMYGSVLPRGPLGQVGAGLGQTTSVGTVTLVPPTVDITATGRCETVDGVRMIFQIAPGAPAPAEMTVYFPEHRALCAPENATHTLHDLLTLRGAAVRDPHGWAKYLTETINLFARETDVVFASHHWPTWGTERVVEFLSLQRDLYGYLHDQTVRLLNQGYVGAEIAERFTLPPAVENVWHTRGYHGSVDHNVKAVYQRYLGWFDGNPAHLWEHPPVESARRHVDFMGGADEVLRKARDAYAVGDYRWVAQVVNYVIFADPANTAAKELQAGAFEQLGYGAENATWRNFYLSGAYELRYGRFGTPVVPDAPTVTAALRTEQIFDALALRVDGPKAWDQLLVTDWHITDEDRIHRVELRNGVLVHYERIDAVKLPDPDAEFTLTRATLVRVLLGGADFEVAVAAGEIGIDGDPVSLAALVHVLDAPDPDFAIVTP